MKMALCDVLVISVAWRKYCLLCDPTISCYQTNVDVARRDARHVNTIEHELRYAMSRKINRPIFMPSHQNVPTVSSISLNADN